MAKIFSNGAHKLIIAIVLLSLCTILTPQILAVVTTTLNNPLDGSISYVNSITFNCSSTTTSPNYISNLSLYTNGTGGWVLNQTQMGTIGSISSTGAVNPGTPTGAVFIPPTGIQISMNRNEYITNITKLTNSQCTTGYVYASDHTTLLATSNAFSGNVATFTTPYLLQNGVTYFIMCAGNLVRANYGASLPSNTLSYSITNSWNSVGYDTGNIWDIYQMGFMASNVSGIFTNTYSTGDTIKWNCKGVDNSSASAFASSNSTFSIFGNNLTYNPITTSGAVEPFTFTITYNDSIYSGVSMIMNYNNTNYTMSQSCPDPHCFHTLGSDTIIFSTNITVPTVSTQTNKSFYFILGLTNSTGTTYQQSSSFNQTINPFLVDNCASYTKPLMNLTLEDEDTQTKINGTIEVSINFFTHGTSNLIGTYNNTFNYLTTTQSNICLNNITNTYDISYTIRYYGNSSYYKQYKIVQLATITNATINQNIILYDLIQQSGSQPFKVIVVGSPLSGQNSNLLVESDRQYVPQNQFLAVEDTVTGADGTGTLNLIQNNQVYNFLVSYNGQVLGTFNRYTVVCQNANTPQCTLTLNLASVNGTVTDFSTYGSISGSYFFDNSTQILYFTYTSLDGYIHTVNQTVTEDDALGNTTICQSSTQGTSGTISCVIPTIYQNTRIVSTIYVDGIFIENNIITLGSSPNYYGVDILIELLMFSCLVMLFLEHPIMIVIGSVLGFIFSVLLLWVTAMSFGSFVGVIAFYIIGGILVIWQIARKI